MKRTKIIATIGPASSSPEMLEALAKGGANIFRLNFSHGDYEWYGELIKRINALNKTLTTPIAIMLDTKGPEIRTAVLEEAIAVKPGDRITLTIDEVDYQKTQKIFVNYHGFIKDIEEGGEVLMDNGGMRLKVLSIKGNDAVCEMLDTGEIGSRRRLNLPGKDLDLPSITEKDWEDIDFGIKQGVDMIALSFVRKSDEVSELKAYLAQKEADIMVISKVESFEATKHLASIVEASDGVMVARGDLGAEIPFAQVPQVQQEIINLGAQYRKPIIVATQMLESMIDHPMPTRAEVTDVAHAIFQETDCIMLSGETAAGKHPLRCIETMVDIATVNEAHVGHFRIRDLPVEEDRDLFAKLAAAIPEDREDLKSIMVMTRTGWTAHVVSNFRPRVPIFAFVPDEAVARKNQLFWGIDSLIVEFSDDPRVTVENARQAFLKHFPQEANHHKCIMMSDGVAGKGLIPTLQIREW
ncbi:MAG TPA: pyruvate kinase [Candidatus Gracilibacteria bacterium]